MDTREIAAQWLIREAGFPATRRERLNITGGMPTDTLQHIDEISVRINPMQATRDDQALDNAHVLGTDFRPIEQPRLSIMEMFP